MNLWNVQTCIVMKWYVFFKWTTSHVVIWFKNRNTFIIFNRNKFIISNRNKFLIFNRNKFLKKLKFSSCSKKVKETVFIIGIWTRHRTCFKNVDLNISANGLDTHCQFWSLSKCSNFLYLYFFLHAKNIFLFKLIVIRFKCRSLLCLFFNLIQIKTQELNSFDKDYILIAPHLLNNLIKHMMFTSCKIEVRH